MDIETGLILMGQRYYDPTAERFLNRDPAWPEGGLNSYNYCTNRPTAMVDPDGCYRDIAGPPEVDSPPSGGEPVDCPGTGYPELPVGGFPGDPVPAVGGAAGGITAGGSVGLLPVAVIVCGIEAGREICTYNPNDPNHNTGPFTCLGSAIWHHCVEPYCPSPVLPPLPVLPPKPIKDPCPVTGDNGGKIQVYCEYEDEAKITKNTKAYYYVCTDGTTRIVEVGVNPPCPDLPHPNERN